MKNMNSLASSTEGSRTSSNDLEKQKPNKKLDYSHLMYNIMNIKNDTKEIRDRFTQRNCIYEKKMKDKMKMNITYEKEFKDHLPKKIIFETHFPKYKKKKQYVTETFNKIFEAGYKIKYLSSTNEPKEAFKKKAYNPFKIIKDFPFHRGIYKNIKNHDFIDFVTDTGGVRTVLLELM